MTDVGAHPGQEQRTFDDSEGRGGNIGDRPLRPAVGSEPVGTDGFPHFEAPACRRLVASDQAAVEESGTPGGHLGSHAM